MKKEPLTVYIPKLILIVSAIVSFGALVGAVGYLIAHPEWKIISPIILPFEKDIIIAVDRAEYQQNEDIKITIENKLDKPVYLGGCNPYIIEKKINSQWSGEPVNCFWEGNSSKISAKSAENFIINAENNQNRSGIYRIRVDYYKDCLLDDLPISQSKCGEGNIVYSNEFIIKEKISTGIGNDLEFETIEKKFYSMNTERKNYVIKNNREWLNLYDKIQGGIDATPDYPNIDFTKNIIVAAFQGVKGTGGYDIEIKRIAEKENEIEVFVIETLPGAECMVTQAFTQPYHIVKVQKSDKEVIFKTEKSVNDCQEAIQNQDVSVVLDKTEYQKGETVNGLIKFNKDIYINPDFRIHKFNNNDWEYLGEWSFDGVQYTCCGVMPNCEVNSVKNSPVKFIWDQKVAKEDLPILPGNKITKIQVARGRYKISVVYGDRPVCIDGIDAEFVIK